MGDLSTSPLDGKTIAIPESRQLDILAKLIENRGGLAHRVPLVAIHDSPDSASVQAWLQRFINKSPDLFIIYTGEGLRRLLGFCDQSGVREQFIAALSRVPLLVRGPKPARVLAELGITRFQSAQAPTTAGVISSLKKMDLSGKEVMLQLYGQEPNPELIDFLTSMQAQIDSVAPYIYASDVETSQVEAFIRCLGHGEIDFVAFTSKAQFNRLQRVAGSSGVEALLHAGLNRTLIAAVGPVVKEAIEAAGYTVAVMPESRYFMKPLVTAIVRYSGTGNEADQCVTGSDAGEKI